MVSLFVLLPAIVIIIALHFKSRFYCNHIPILSSPRRRPLLLFLPPNSNTFCIPLPTTKRFQRTLFLLFFSTFPLAVWGVMLSSVNKRYYATVSSYYESSSSSALLCRVGSGSLYTMTLVVWIFCRWQDQIFRLHFPCHRSLVCHIVLACPVSFRPAIYSSVLSFCWCCLCCSSP